MNSKIMKARILDYLRFKRGMMCATEVGCNSAYSDVCAVSKDFDKSIEVEIKISMPDLKADFRNKKAKHVNALGIESNGAFKTNYMVFAFPSSIIDQALKYLNNKEGKYKDFPDRHLKYGVWEVLDSGQIVIRKQMRRLNHSSNKRLFNRIALRCNTEMVKYLHQTLDLKPLFMV